ncbi:Putative integral membrane protein [hydrothermal vent metagenome]|uniref:Integral membrane protein n=1 Tax=hydrothermal vent metagenome TaxID=652676 RepID=A0A3B1E7C4_9ZZZZ
MAKCAPINLRIKAFITDMFMIMMPIMYIATYIILNGKDDFQSNNIAKWLTMFSYGLIIIIFWTNKGQTPGFKAYNIKLINQKTKENLNFIQATIRYIMFIISAISIVGILLPFFRKDKKTLQDLTTNTCVIIEE